MKLTAEMFDFEKYEYAVESVAGKEWLTSTEGWVIGKAHGVGLTRSPKPPPRYILLNEGEALQAGDQRAWPSADGFSLKWLNPLTQENAELKPSLRGEVWRRKAP